MNEPFIVEESDALLLPFLQARDHSTAEGLLTHLIQEHADPIIAKILKRKLRVSLNGAHGNQEKRVGSSQQRVDSPGYGQDDVKDDRGLCIVAFLFQEAFGLVR